jgi:hypothetical protein
MIRMEVCSCIVVQIRRKKAMIKIVDGLLSDGLENTNPSIVSHPRLTPTTLSYPSSTTPHAVAAAESLSPQFHFDLR